MTKPLKPKSTGPATVERDDFLSFATSAEPLSDSLFGSMRGLVLWMDPTIDLTEPILDEPCDAELGILIRGGNGEDISGVLAGPPAEDDAG